MSTCLKIKTSECFPANSTPGKPISFLFLLATAIRPSPNDSEETMF